MKYQTIASRLQGMPLSFALFLCCFAAVTNAAENTIVVTDGPTLTMNPNAITPLAGIVEVAVNVPVRLTLEVETDLERRILRFPDYATQHAVPLLGLKPNASHTIRLMVSDTRGTSRRLDTELVAATDPLPADFPQIDVIVNKPQKMEPGFTLINEFVRGTQTVPGTRYSIILDRFGEVVWYSTLGSSFMQQLPDGNLQTAYLMSNTAVTTDMLGREVSTVTLQDPNDFLHHEFFTTKAGTYLSLTREGIAVNDYPTSEFDCTAPSKPAVIEDNPVVEFDADGHLRNYWRLTDILQTNRIGYWGLHDVALGFDWAHANAVIEDLNDDSLIVSIRHQDALVKFSRSGLLKWILAPHDNWSAEFEPFLLDPVGQPFQWQYHQHAPMLTDTGTLIVHDNANFQASPCKPRLSSAEIVSRAVEYEIDENSMSVRQVWEYGSQVEDKLSSPSRGDADWLPITGNVLITFSDVQFVNGIESASLGLGSSHTRVVEVTRESPAEEVFYVRLYEPDAPDETSAITSYRSDRIPSLYSPDVEIFDSDIIGEVTVDLKWKDLCPGGFEEDSIVLLGPPTFEGPDSGVMRVRAGDREECPYQIRFQEWDYHYRDKNDTSHRNEKVSYLGLSPGIYEMDDGAVWEVGSFPLSLSGAGVWKRVPFQVNFASAPFVFVTMQSFNGKQAATVRVRRVGSEGFQAAIFEEEYLMAADRNHWQEDIGYVAIYHPNADTSNSVRGQARLNGIDYSYLLQRISADNRWKEVENAQLKLQEEQSRDTEVNHTLELLDVLQIGDQVFAQDVSSLGWDTVSVRRR